jgi:hypothetical protein
MPDQRAVSHPSSELVLETRWVQIWHDDVQFSDGCFERHVVVRPPTFRPSVAILPVDAAQELSRS